MAKVSKKTKITRDEFTEKSMETLEKTTGWLELWDWADLVYAEHSDIAAVMDSRGAGWAIPKPGRRVIWGELQGITRGNQRQPKNLIVDTSGIKKVTYASDEEIEEYESNAEAKEEEYLSRKDIIKRDEESLTQIEKWNIDDFYVIAKMLNDSFNLDFEVDHAKALMNPIDPGNHHPDNLQILSKRFNGIKNSKNWDRYSWEEQEEHIRDCVDPYLKNRERLDIDGTKEDLDYIIDRLKKIY